MIRCHRWSNDAVFEPGEPGHPKLKTGQRLSLSGSAGQRVSGSAGQAGQRVSGSAGQDPQTLNIANLRLCDPKTLNPETLSGSLPETLRRGLPETLRVRLNPKP